MTPSGRALARCRAFATAVAAALLLAVAVGAEGTADRAEAERLLAEGQPARAAEVLRDLAEAARAREAPAEEVAEIESLLGRALSQAGDPQASLPHFEDALAVRETSEDRLSYAEALVSVARENLRAGGATAARVVPYLDDAIASAARVTDGAFAKRRLRATGEARYWRGDLEEAARLLRESAPDAAEGPPAIRALETLANALYRLGRFPESAEAFRAAGSVRGEASAWTAARSADRAIPLYAAAIRGSPADAALVEEAVLAARYVDARDALARALAEIPAEGPVAARLLHARGTLARESGDASAAKGLFEQAAAADPAWSAPLVELARSLLAPGPDAAAEAEARPAIEALREALRRNPEDPGARELLWFLAGREYAAGTRGGGDAGALARGAEILRALTEADPEDPLAWANLGNTLRMAGEAEGAVAAYRRAEDLNPYDASVVSDHGLALLAAGRPDEALAAFERASALDASATAPRQNAARLRWLRGDDEGAERLLGGALRAARDQGDKEMTYRFLLDRVYRTRRHPEWR